MVEMVVPAESILPMLVRYTALGSCDTNHFTTMTRPEACPTDVTLPFAVTCITISYGIASNDVCYTVKNFASLLSRCATQNARSVDVV